MLAELHRGVVRLGRPLARAPVAGDLGGGATRRAGAIFRAPRPRGKRTATDSGRVGNAARQRRTGGVRRAGVAVGGEIGAARAVEHGRERRGAISGRWGDVLRDGADAQHPVSGGVSARHERRRLSAPAPAGGFRFDGDPIPARRSLPSSGRPLSVFGDPAVGPSVFLPQLRRPEHPR